MKTIPSLIASVILLAYTSMANATNFELADIYVSLNQSDSGLQLDYEAVTPYTDFDLDYIGASYTFPLFHIWTDETTVNPDDLDPQSIKVALNFSSPEFIGGPIEGSTFGGKVLIYQYGKVTWDDPVFEPFGNTGLVAISLSDESFNHGLFGLQEGEKYGATVNAKVKLLQVDAPVPEPGTFLLLGTGLVALGVCGRRKCNKSAA